MCGSHTKPAGSVMSTPDLRGVSYSAQYDHLMQQPLESIKFNSAMPKPSHSAQKEEPGAWRIPFSDVFTLPKHTAFWSSGKWTAAHMLAMHAMCLLAPLYYTRGLAFSAAVLYVVFGLGTEMVYHRMLSHRSFTTAKCESFICSLHSVQSSWTCSCLRLLVYNCLNRSGSADNTWPFDLSSAAASWRFSVNLQTWGPDAVCVAHLRRPADAVAGPICL